MEHPDLFESLSAEFDAIHQSSDNPKVLAAYRESMESETIEGHENAYQKMLAAARGNRQ